MKINNILCEYLENPLGIGIRNPRITWNLEGLIKQTAYEVVYKINDEKHSSGIIKSDSMNYTFKDNFKSRDYISYQIRVANEEGVWSELSLVNYFEFGLLNKEDWKAKWIKGDYRPKKNKRYPVDYFKKTFELKDIKKARLYISACGLYEVHINNKRVGDAILTPGSTDYHKRIQYQTYDITNLLNEGKNEIVILLADGWYRGSIGAKGFTNVFGKETKFISQIEVFDIKNVLKSIISDETWNYSSDGPLRFADLKDGEIVDNNLIPSFNKKAKVIKFNANLKESNNEFVKENEVSTPINSFKSKSNKTIFEFKNNVAGYISFKCLANKNDTVDIVLGEILDENNEVSLKNVQCIRKNKKTPLQEIHLICKEGLNEYHSKFFYGGFKYASVSTKAQINQGDFKQIALSTKLIETAKFTCSNNLINIFYENTLRSLKSNSIDIPTDCPTRERMGWTGDSQVFFETASFLTNYASFTRKHLNDVFDRQDKNGRLPQIAPYSAEDWYMDAMNGSVGWADVGILTPYRFYKKYNDKRILEDNFENMEKYAKFMIKRCGRVKGIYAVYASPLHLSKENRKYQVNNGQSYGEWAEPNDVKPFNWLDFCQPHPEESMAYTVWMMELMAEICDILNKKENKNLYLEYAKGVKKAYQELVTKPKFSLDTNCQAKLVRPLYLNLLNSSQEEYAKKRLIEALDFYKWRLGTGFLSTPFILDVLSKINPEYAYKLLENEEMPGWLFMAKNNTGTIWEGWEGPRSQQGISSLNHYSKGAMVEWLFKGMCGINLKSENEFDIKPIIGGNVNFAKAEYNSIYGLIKVSWKKNNNKVTFIIDVPANTKVNFIYKDKKTTLLAGNYTLTDL